MRVYLIGYMGSGKTRIGQELSALTGYPLIDTDQLFEERYRISILDFFERYSEESFRKIENQLLLETLYYPDAIIATGGGTPCYFDNMDVIKRNGISIYLKMDLIPLIDRLAGLRKKRPLLKNKTTTELESFIRTQLAEREPYYSQADFTVNAGSINVNEVLHLITDIHRAT
jgi:shikimate kinase